MKELKKFVIEIAICLVLFLIGLAAAKICQCFGADESTAVFVLLPFAGISVLLFPILEDAL